MSEITLVKEILAVIGSRNDVRVWRNNTGTLIDSLGLVGSADILGIIAPQGRFLAIECKTRTGKQSDQQRNFQKMIEAMGGIYILARSLEDVKW
jgi:hypothetical protein